jgi:hypothetical protein
VEGAVRQLDLLHPRAVAIAFAGRLDERVAGAVAVEVDTEEHPREDAMRRRVLAGAGRVGGVELGAFEGRVVHAALQQVVAAELVELDGEQPALVVDLAFQAAVREVARARLDRLHERRTTSFLKCAR